MRSGRLAREQGMALVAVMLLLMAMSALAAALAISSTTETMIARNHQNAAQARAAAEAGLSHAIDITLDYLAVWQGDFASVDLAMDALLTDPAMYIMGFDDVEAGVILAGTGTTFSSIALSVGSFSSIFYEATLIDDDDQAARDITLSADDLMRMGEPDGDPDDDQNQTFVIRAIGYAGGSAVSAIEATIGPRSMPGLLTDGDLELAGNVTLAGDQGAAHTNGDFYHKGGSWSASQGCTASGDSDDDDCEEGSATIALPDTSADDYLSLANYILHDNGEMTTVSTGVTGTCSPCAGGWTFSSGTWRLNGTLTSPAAASAFYVETSVQLSADNRVTIFSTGSITAGNGDWEPSLAGLLMVMDGDMSETGNPNLGTAGNPGLIVIGEQLDLGGNVTIYGAVIVRDASNASSDVTANSLSGSVSITYDGGLDGRFFSVSAWRRSY
jgi:hypothetical protein